MAHLQLSNRGAAGVAGSQHAAAAGGISAAAYPPAQASHDAVVADRQLFMRTLRALHEALGTQFRIPMVSGRELDLHLLYKQVRCRPRLAIELLVLTAILNSALAPGSLLCRDGQITRSGEYPI